MPGVEPKVVRPLCVEDAGFSLHAATHAGADDEQGCAKPFRYVLRPPIAQEHVTLTEEGLVAVKLKRPFRDGTVSVEMDPLSFVPASPPGSVRPGFNGRIRRRARPAQQLEAAHRAAAARTHTARGYCAYRRSRRRLPVCHLLPPGKDGADGAHIIASIKRYRLAV